MENFDGEVCTKIFNEIIDIWTF